MAEQKSDASKTAVECNGGNIKLEPLDLDDEEDGAPPAFGPAALGLHRVGTKLPPKPTPSEPLQKLNARGMPARIRKKNRLFFDDDIINAPPPRSSPKRGPKTPGKSPTKQTASAKKQKTPMKFSKREEKKDKNEKSESISLSPDRKAGQRIGMRLRNLLKLPKAHKWVCYEYFYSNIDQTLFDGENDFTICLRESFPQLKNRKLTQVQWTKIRRMMGKPRRCSQAFFSEERNELERKRQVIRYIQQRNTAADICFKDLPEEIPMQLVVGTKVTARLRKPQDGLFTGSIDAVDTSDNTYRISFERPGLGTQSVPDFEVLSSETPDTISLAAISQKFRPRQLIQDFINLHENTSQQPDPMSSFNSSCNNLDTTVGGYPVELLELIVRIKKILNIKKGKILRLKQYNDEVERFKSFNEKIPNIVCHNYKDLIFDLENINGNLHYYINEIRTYCNRIAPSPTETAMLAPTVLRERCFAEAAVVVERNNNGDVRDEKVLNLITALMALLIQLKTISDTDQNACELKLLQGTIDQIKAKLSTSHHSYFQNNVEIHMQHIQMGLGKSNVDMTTKAGT